VTDQGGETRPENPATQGAKHLLRLALLVAISAPVLVLAGAVGTKLGLWDWKVGFGLMTVGWAPKAAFLGLITGLVALYVAAFAGFRRLWPLAAIALIVPAATVVGFGGLRAKASAVPPIHDYATDWREPIMPSPALLAARGPEANPLVADPRMKLAASRPEVENWADDRVSRIGSEACPGAKPVTLTQAPAEAQTEVKAALTGAGLTVSTEAPGRIEATATSFWYGFKDDVIARVRPEGAGSRVDFRSVSRVGQSDLGRQLRTHHRAGRGPRLSYRASRYSLPSPGVSSAASTPVRVMCWRCASTERAAAGCSRLSTQRTSPAPSR
jgi:fatty-acyl-CoA synthase